MIFFRYGQIFNEVLFDYFINKIYFCTAKQKHCGSSSVGRASASQAEGHGFESRLPLHLKIKQLRYKVAAFLMSFYLFNTALYGILRQYLYIYGANLVQILHRKLMDKATANCYLDTRRIKANGKYPLKIRVQHR